MTETTDNVISEGGVNLYKGIAASSGIVIGKAYVLDSKLICILKHTYDSDNMIDDEVSRYRETVEQSASEMSLLSKRARVEFGDVPNMIFDAHVQLLRDPSMSREVEAVIRKERCNAEWALKTLMEKYQARFSKFKDKYFRERLDDIEHVVNRLQTRLSGGEAQKPFADISEPVIVVAHDLTPSDTLLFDPKHVIGFAIDRGGATSHAGILASSLDIPAGVGLKKLSANVSSGDPLVVDGNLGKVIHKPTMDQFQNFNQRRQRWLYMDKTVHAEKGLRAKTSDGVTINVMANIESSHDLGHLEEHGAEGVGLYRTEYLYINRQQWPDEDEQYIDYKRVSDAVKPNCAIIRTLDIGGDKLPDNSLYDEQEPNPALGLRAIRFCLQNREIFKTQLRAILRASTNGNLRIMYPLITTVKEVTDANDLLSEVMDELDDEKIPYDKNISVGAMIETPAAAMLASELAIECDFFSIGTNDLIQYTMAIDRVNEKVAYLYQPFSPAILRMIERIVKAADKEKISVSVCGKIAGDPAYAMLLLGMGSVDSLSMDVHSIPRIKKFIRSISNEEAKKVAIDVMGMEDEDQIIGHISNWLAGRLPDGVTSELAGNAN